MLIICAGCGKRFSDRAPACPFCERKPPKVAAAPAASAPTPAVAPPPRPSRPRPACPRRRACLRCPTSSAATSSATGSRSSTCSARAASASCTSSRPSTRSTTHALKTLRNELLRDGKSRESFRKEAQIWIDLGPHPNLVRAHWITEIGGRLYIAMEHVQSNGGRPNSLEGYLEKRPPSLAQALSWSIQFCHGMEYAVSQGVRCHRDIKPANILIGEDDVVRISDFGIAGLALPPERRPPGERPSRTVAVEAGRTVAGSVFGTPTHMSPEQFQDAASCDERSDIYSFGVVLYQMAASGGLPFLPAPPPPGVDPMAWYWHQFRACTRARRRRRWPRRSCRRSRAASRRRPASATRASRPCARDLEALYREQAGPRRRRRRGRGERRRSCSTAAISLGALGRHAEALEVFDRALAKAPGEWSIWNSRGNALRPLGRIDEALGLLRQGDRARRPVRRALGQQGSRLRGGGP